jgi:hypothetical protein
MSANHLFSFLSPAAIARTATGLAMLAVRRPALFAQLLLEGLRDRKALVRLVRLPVDLDAIRGSPLFDAEWYRRNHPDLEHSPLSPELHCLLNRIPEGRWTSPHFSCDEYLSLNPGVEASGVHPLAHYELYGRFIDCPASARDLEPDVPSFPPAAVESERLLDRLPAKHRRTAVFATFSSDGRIPEKDLLYLRALREVCDNVVVSANSPLFPEETERLGGLASALLCRWHGGYDFGSWRAGMRLARESGWLDASACDELVLANGSCYAPVRPFPPMFDAMAERKADFWSVTQYGKPREGTRRASTFLQSYFLVFRRAVLDSAALEDFFEERPARITRHQAVELFEMQLTDFMRDRGFRPDSFVRPGRLLFRNVNPTTRPIDLIRRFGVPMVKAKAFSGQTGQPPEKVHAVVRRLNPALASLVRFSEPPRPRPAASREESASSRAALAARIGVRVREGRPARVLFLVSSASMFPARPLLGAMRADPAFEPHLAVVPDLRWPDRDPVQGMEPCERELAAAFPGLLLPPLRPGADGDWPDVLAGFDLAVYPSPYEFSHWRYNPMRADAAGVLGVHANYGFYRSVYDRAVLALESYARFWRVFAECDATMAELRAHAAGGGANAEVVGYVKMDALASAEPWPRNGGRRRVLIAPHHSVEGGANDTLALSNFQRYADYFLALPERHPELDFVFRPHPFLFTVLSNPSKWGREKVDGWIARMKAHPNVRWSDEGVYFPAFVSCDACVQDCGSYLVEWLYTGKPCCYMLKAPSDIDAKFAPLGKDCLSHCYLAYDEAAIESFLCDVVEGGADPKAAARDEFRRSVMVNHPHAADAALDSIRRGLGIA